MKSRTVLVFLFSLSAFIGGRAQPVDTVKLEQLLRAHASPFLKQVLDHPEVYHYQLIYTQIDRDRKNRPVLRNYSFRLDTCDYFNPASMAKLPTAIMALEKLNTLRPKGIGLDTPMLTDSAYGGQTRVEKDTSAANGWPTVGHYVKKIFLVSDNDAYNRLYEFVGQEMLNTRLREMGYSGSRITRRFVTMTEDQNRHTNPIRFTGEDGRLLYEQPAAFNRQAFDFSKRILVGKAHYNRNDSLLNQPMDFTTHNCLPLPDLQRMMQAVIFPNSVPGNQRFQLDENDRKFLLKYMSKLPSESRFPNYDTSAFFDSYTKFFFFKDGRRKLPPSIRSFNKTGWSYGYLIDVCYIVDFAHKVEYMLSGVIYVNSDEVLNDDKYEYESIGYPFFREVGEIIHAHELQRKRKRQPDLSSFQFNYAD
ncbi:class A beta-lactamase-related serine hydrolase [Flavihumibacter rivuli]|uniref:serine hydrolase n=1 Tax=Flavihumibacter rivuli TaxID=2838156 RepID=UPI001BDF164E|nr:serine hydrolase [Flavihumibacter rivuli]ULQ55362.1 class A beta-lactamase-related serine hydrolase [Flavihumibacter rivuli]